MVPTHTYDLAEGIWKLIIHGFPYGIYHLTHTGYCSWYEFAMEVLKIAGIKATVKPARNTEFPAKAKRPLWSVLGTRRGMSLGYWKNGLIKFFNNGTID